jgi:3-oxoadipate enol-lactonase
VGLDTTCWRSVAERLVGTWRVICLDLRGHGASPKAPLTSVLGEYADDVAFTLESIELPAAPVVGVSFGGMVATALAVNHPQRVSALVASACASAIPDAARETLRARGKAAVENGMESLLEETLERWFTDAFRAGPDVEPYRQRLLSDDPNGWCAAWHAIAGMDMTGDLERIKAPALCIHAANDRATPLEAMQTTVAHIPDARLTVIEGAPHMVHVERPDAFTKALSDFLAPN